MFVLHIIPALNIPRPADQLLTYFCAQEVAVGGLVLIKIKNSLQVGLVAATESVKHSKSSLRQANFELRKIEKILAAQPILPNYLVKFIQQQADYWWTSFGLILKMVLPSYLISYIKKHHQLPPDTFLANQMIKNEQTLELFPYAPLEKSADQSAEFYSGLLTAKRKFELWNQVRLGKITHIYASRSGIYLPFVNLKKIIVHQAENNAYKSWDQKPYYDARRVALHLAKLTGAKLKYHSPNPPIWLLKAGPGIKLSQHPKPSSTTKVKLIDLKTYSSPNKLPPLFSPPVLEAIHQFKKILIFYNRRGIARLTYCSDCGHQFNCPTCQIPLILHQTNPEKQGKKYKFVCHHCGHQQAAPDRCSRCRSSNLKTFGAGTEQLSVSLLRNSDTLEVDQLFQINQDLTPRLADQLTVIKRFHQAKKGVLIATAQVLKFLSTVNYAPGLGHPAQNTRSKLFDASVVPLAELELNFPDYLVRETAFQDFYRILLATKKEFIIQTLNPQDQFFGDLAQKSYNKFVQHELILRKRFYFPPYCHLIKLSYSHKNPAKAKKAAQALYERLTIQWRHLSASYQLPAASAQLLGPAPAFIPRQKGRYHWQILLKLPLNQNKLKHKLLLIVPSDWRVDVEPIDTL